MKNLYGAVVFLGLVSGIQMSDAAEHNPQSILCKNSKKKPGALQKLIGSKQKGSRVSFGDDQIYEITPRHKKQEKRRRSIASPADVPLALRQEAQSALAVLAAAKKPVVAPTFDETTARISARLERGNAVARHEAPKKLEAAKKVCEETRVQLNRAAATVAVRFPIKRTPANYWDKAKK